MTSFTTFIKTQNIMTAKTMKKFQDLQFNINIIKNKNAVEV